VVATSEGCIHIAAPAVSVVDTTGAGDVLVGTLAARLADGQSVHGAVSAAVDRASASVTGRGARLPLPS